MFLLKPKLYHGSNVPGIELFEPRQAKYMGKPDGPPAIHATPNFETAVFMAVVGKIIVDEGNAGGWDTYAFPGSGFYIYEDAADAISEPGHVGYVYELPRRYFKQRIRGFDDHIALREVKPVDMVTVTLADLPDDITYGSRDAIYDAINRAEAELPRP